jgi:hypothetical protein
MGKYRRIKGIGQGVYRERNEKPLVVQEYQGLMDTSLLQSFMYTRLSKLHGAPPEYRDIIIIDGYGHYSTPTHKMTLLMNSNKPLINRPVG